MGRCPVLLSTVMVHRAEVASGLLFADAEAPAELSWIELAARRDVLGLDEILTEAPGDPSDAPERLEALLLRLEEDPLHGRQPFELERLRSRLKASVLDPAGLRL
jgi:hypothetical protein